MPSRSINVLDVRGSEAGNNIDNIKIDNKRGTWKAYAFLIVLAFVA